MTSSDIKIIHMDEVDKDRWNGFLSQAPGASLYHRFEWKRVMEEALGHRTFYLAALSGGSIRGVLPLVYVRSRIFGRILCSMPFLNYGGVCALDLPSEMALVNEVKKIVQDLGVDYAEIRDVKPLTDELPTGELLVSTHKVSMTLNLAGDPDEVWDSYHTKHRTQIRRSFKNGLTVRSGGAEMLDVFYTILSESFRNLGTPLLAKSFFAHTLDMFEDSSTIYVVYHGQDPVAAAFNGHFDKTVEGLWAGTRSGALKLGAVYVLYWEMIREACENGYEKYHMGRSTGGSGGEFSKSKWNAYARPLYWHYCLGHNREIPELNVENSKYLLAINLWKKMPLSLANSLGPPLARNIP